VAGGQSDKNKQAARGLCKNKQVGMALAQQRQGLEAKIDDRNMVGGVLFKTKRAAVFRVLTCGGHQKNARAQ
jgi:hypothetical protein